MAKSKPKQPADPNALDADGRTALHHAVARKDAKAVKQLLAAGASYDRKDRDGFLPTQLMYSEDHKPWGIDFKLLPGFKPIERVFMDWLHDPRCKATLTFLNISNLYSCILNDELAGVRELLDSSTVEDVNLRLADGTTPLHVAAKRGNPRMVKLLLDHGAEVVVVDRAGRAPVDIAVEHGHKKIVELLANVRPDERAPVAPTKVTLASIEAEIVERTLRDVRDCYELEEIDEPLSSLVFSADVVSCGAVYINVPELRDADLATRGRIGDIATGRRIEGRFFSEDDAHELESLCGLDAVTAIDAVMHRVCARLECERKLWKGVELARSLRVLFLDHSSDDIAPERRALARAMLGAPIEAYLRAAEPEAAEPPTPKRKAKSKATPKRKPATKRR